MLLYLLYNHAIKYLNLIPDQKGTFLCDYSQLSSCDFIPLIGLIRLKITKILLASQLNHLHEHINVEMHENCDQSRCFYRDS